MNILLDCFFHFSQKYIGILFPTRHRIISPRLPILSVSPHLNETNEDVFSNANNLYFRLLNFMNYQSCFYRVQNLQSQKKLRLQNLTSATAKTLVPLQCENFKLFFLHRFLRSTARLESSINYVLVRIQRCEQQPYRSQNATNYKEENYNAACSGVLIASIFPLLVHFIDIHFDINDIAGS